MNTNIINTKKVEFVERAKAIIKGYDELKEIWQAVILTAEKMNGKVFNKRFGDAVNLITEKKCGRVSFSDPYNMGYKGMSVFINSRSYKASGGCWDYIDGSLYASRLHNAEKDLLTDGRIDAAKVKECANNMLSIIASERAKYVDGIKNYDRDQKRKQKALKDLAEAFAKINPLFVPSQLSKYDWEKMLKG